MDICGGGGDGQGDRVDRWRGYWTVGVQVSVSDGFSYGSKGGEK